MKFCYTILFLIITTATYSQEHPGFSRLYRYESETDTILRNELISSLHYDTATKLVFFGASVHQAFSGTANTFNLLFKADINGNILLRKTDSIAGYDLAYKDVAELDGYLYWVGWMVHEYPLPDSANQRTILTKTDKDLNIIWQKQYPNELKVTQPRIVRADHIRKELLITGSEWTSVERPGFPITPERATILKTDTAGNMIWKRNIGPNNKDYAAAIAFTDTGYVISGRTYGWGPDRSKPFLISTDTAAIEEWYQTYLTELAGANSNILLQELGEEPFYYLIGEALQTEISYQTGYIYKVNGAGAILWNRIAGSDTLAKGFFGGCQREDNKAIVACGFKDRAQSDAVGPSGWLVRYDTNGVEIWDRRVTASPREYDHEYLYNIVALPDGGFMAAGSSYGIDARGRWSQDGWLVRVDSLGCMSSDCDPLSLNTAGNLKGYGLNIYPNPASGSFSLSSGKPLPEGTTISLYDITGRLLRRLPDPSSGNIATYRLQGLSPGMYLVEINSKEGRVSLKLCLQ